jgi:hypothetical protein
LKRAATCRLSGTWTRPRSRLTRLGTDGMCVLIHVDCDFSVGVHWRCYESWGSVTILGCCYGRMRRG